LAFRFGNEHKTLEREHQTMVLQLVVGGKGNGERIM